MKYPGKAISNYVRIIVQLQKVRERKLWKIILPEEILAANHLSQITVEVIGFICVKYTDLVSSFNAQMKT